MLLSFEINLPRLPWQARSQYVRDHRLWLAEFNDDVACRASCRLAKCRSYLRSTVCLCF